MHSLENFQFVILAIAVAMTTYVGTVARGIASSIRKDIYTKKLEGDKFRERTLGKQRTLWALIAADILLILIAGLTVLRVGSWFNLRIGLIQVGSNLTPILDQALVILILITVVFMAFLHLVQWIIWFRIAIKKPERKTNVMKLIEEIQSEFRSKFESVLESLESVAKRLEQLESEKQKLKNKIAALEEAIEREGKNH